MSTTPSPRTESDLSVSQVKPRKPLSICPTDAEDNPTHVQRDSSSARLGTALTPSRAGQLTPRYHIQAFSASLACRDRPAPQVSHARQHSKPLDENSGTPEPYAAVDPALEDLLIRHGCAARCSTIQVNTSTSNMFSPRRTKVLYSSTKIIYRAKHILSQPTINFDYDESRRYSSSFSSYHNRQILTLPPINEYNHATLQHIPASTSQSQYYSKRSIDGPHEMLRYSPTVKASITNITPRLSCDPQLNVRPHSIEGIATRSSTQSFRRHQTIRAGTACDQLRDQSLFFSYDTANDVTACWLSQCNHTTMSTDGSTCICPRCGSYSAIRYCSVSHLRADILYHYKYHCGRRSYHLPFVDENTIHPTKEPMRAFIDALRPQDDSFERHRQAVYRAFPTNPDVDYHIFSDTDLLTSAELPDRIPTPVLLAKYRGKGQVVATVVLSDDSALKARFSIALEKMLRCGCTAGSNAPEECAQFINCVKAYFLERGLWDTAMVQRIGLATQLEFGYKIPLSLLYDIEPQDG